MVQVFWNLKACPQCHTSSNRATVPNLSQRVPPTGTKYSNIWACGDVLIHRWSVSSDTIQHTSQRECGNLCCYYVCNMCGSAHVLWCVRRSVNHCGVGSLKRGFRKENILFFCPKPKPSQRTGKPKLSENLLALSGEWPCAGSGVHAQPWLLFFLLAVVAIAATWPSLSQQACSSLGALVAVTLSAAVYVAHVLLLGMAFQRGERRDCPTSHTWIQITSHHLKSCVIRAYIYLTCVWEVDFLFYFISFKMMSYSIPSVAWNLR